MLLASSIYSMHSIQRGACVKAKTSWFALCYPQVVITPSYTAPSADRGSLLPSLNDSLWQHLTTSFGYLTKQAEHPRYLPSCAMCSAAWTSLGTLHCCTGFSQ